MIAGRLKAGRLDREREPARGNGGIGVVGVAMAERLLDLVRSEYQFPGPHREVVRPLPTRVGVVGQGGPCRGDLDPLRHAPVNRLEERDRLRCPIGLALSHQDLPPEGRGAGAAPELLSFDSRSLPASRGGGIILAGVVEEQLRLLQEGQESGLAGGESPGLSQSGRPSRPSLLRIVTSSSLATISPGTGSRVGLRRLTLLGEGGGNRRSSGCRAAVMRFVIHSTRAESSGTIGLKRSAVETVRFQSPGGAKGKTPRS